MSQGICNNLVLIFWSVLVITICAYLLGTWAWLCVNPQYNVTGTSNEGHINPQTGVQESLPHEPLKT